MIKKCTKCEKNKDIGQFYSSDLYWCKTCRADYSRVKNGSAQVRKDLSDGSRICNKCKWAKKLEDFPKDKKCKLGRSRTCKECVYKSRENRKDNQKRLAKKWYLENKELTIKRQQDRYGKNKERLKAYGRQHAKDNPEIYKAAFHRRRAAIEGNGRNDLSAGQIVWMFRNFPNCVYCGAKGDLTIDHVVPISKGGENTLSNVVPACSECNNHKRAKIVNVVGIQDICKLCFEVQTDRILSSAEWAKIHEQH